MSSDPLLQPFQLKHLTLKNRLIVTAHEPAYPEDGMPKGRYRAYHVERAKGGVALTMTAGSAAVSRDSPPVFNNILAWQDEVVKWTRELTDAVHEAGSAIMIQLTHLGRRTRWDKALIGYPWSRPRTTGSARTGPSPRSWRTGISPGLSATSAMRPSGCRLRGWMGSKSRPMATC